jgi:hypothetical protein
MTVEYDFSRFRTVNDMDDAQRRAWLRAGKPPLGPEQPQPKSAATMTREAQEGWDRWAVAHVQNGADQLAYIVGQEVGKIRRAHEARIEVP